jgi:hypothetical protein
VALFFYLYGAAAEITFKRTTLGYDRRIANVNQKASESPLASILHRPRIKMVASFPRMEPP